MADPGSRTIRCSRCAAVVPGEELAQGLAVRVGGRPVCAQCVDALPAATRGRIELLRRLRGAGATYRVLLPRRPGVQAFTFSSAAALRLHRLVLQRDGAFSAPPLPARRRPRSWRDALVVASAALLVAVGLGLMLRDRAAAHAAAAPPPAASAPAVPAAPRAVDPLPVEAPAPPSAAPPVAVAPPAPAPVPPRPAAVPASPPPTIAADLPPPPAAPPPPPPRATPAPAPHPVLLGILSPVDLPRVAAAEEFLAPAPWPSLAWAEGGLVPRPAAGARFARSRRGELAWTVDGEALRGGGLLLAIHAGDARRRRIEVRWDDLLLPPLECPSGRWSVQAVALPPGAGGRLRLVAGDAHPAPFWLAAVAGAAVAPPGPGLLEATVDHLPAALASRQGEALLRQRIAAADGARRGAGGPTFAAAPALLAQVRVVGGGLPEAAKAALRDELAAMQGSPCRRGQVQEDGEPGGDGWCAWFRREQAQMPGQARRLVPLDRYGVLLLLAPGAADAHAVAGTIALAQELPALERLVLAGDPRTGQAGGLLLVVGIGGYDAPEAPLPAGLAQARTALRRACERAGTPFIDPLAAASAVAGRSARAAALAHVLGDGLACLVDRFLALAPGRS